MAIYEPVRDITFDTDTRTFNAFGNDFSEHQTYMLRKAYEIMSTAEWLFDESGCDDSAYSGAVGSMEDAICVAEDARYLMWKYDYDEEYAVGEALSRWEGKDGD